MSTPTNNEVVAVRLQLGRLSVLIQYEGFRFPLICIMVGRVDVVAAHHQALSLPFKQDSVARTLHRSLSLDTLLPFEVLEEEQQEAQKQQKQKEEEKDFKRIPSAPSLQSLINNNNNNSNSHSNSNNNNNANTSTSPVLALDSESYETAELLDAIRKGLEVHAPELVGDGIGGNYFLKDVNGETIAVFKPVDEEGDSPLNPKARSSEEEDVDKKLRNGTILGEGAYKEAAAYLLDHDHFHGVPETTIAKITHPWFQRGEGLATRVGSVQKYIPNECAAEEMGPKMFSVQDVHRIGLLDLRVLNTDRHLGNILVTSDDGASYGLVPIDHGLSLPSELSDGLFEWLSFPQSKVPFDAATLDYISRLDADSDVAMLRQRLPQIRPECLDTLKICTLFLKKAAMMGFTLHRIGRMMSRYDDPDEPCLLEMLVKQARDESAQGAAASFWDALSSAMDLALQEGK